MQPFPPQGHPSQQPQWGGPPPPQPHTFYPQQQQPMPYAQQPMYQPPVQPAKKPWYRSPLGIGCLITLLLACGIFGIIGATAHGPSPSASPDTANITMTQPVSTSVPPQQAAPTHALAWRTTHLFSGNGSKKTAVFAVGNDWKIVYACTYQSIGGITADGALAVTVYGSDNTIMDPGAINSTCPTSAKITKGETEEHQGGQVYLSVDGTGNWAIAIQELE